ncbi:MAG TPA: proton-conducting transporter membrane subunit, partial [Rhizobiaceae bacterium]|nr:proton-conducting transporter membrane subunit [Rhizobiaceae bacterium]
ARRAGIEDHLVPGPQMAMNGMVAALFFAAAIAMAGMPPFSGFVGKLLVMTSAREHELVWLIWTVVLTTSLMAVVGFARAGSLVFWKTEGGTAANPDMPAQYLSFTAICALIGLVVLLTVAAGPVSEFLGATAAQIHDPLAYHDAVLQGSGEQPR